MNNFHSSVSAADVVRRISTLAIVADAENLRVVFGKLLNDVALVVCPSVAVMVVRVIWALVTTPAGRTVHAKSQPLQLRRLNYCLSAIPRIV